MEEMEKETLLGQVLTKQAYFLFKFLFLVKFLISAIIQRNLENLSIFSYFYNNVKTRLLELNPGLFPSLLFSGFFALI